MQLTRLEKEIIFDEGFRPKIYLDEKGHPTIGIGLNLDAGISKSLAIAIMRNQIDKIQEQLRYKLPFWNLLSTARQDVLVNMSFNMGVKGLMGFHNMIAAMSEGNWKRAAYELMDSKAARELPERYGRLEEKMLKG